MQLQSTLLTKKSGRDKRLVRKGEGESRSENRSVRVGMSLEDDVGAHA